MKKNIKKNLERRLKIIDGQIKGLQRMVDEDVYCVDIITQNIKLYDKHFLLLKM